MRKSNTILGMVGTTVRTTASSLASLLPAALADDNKSTYLENFGDCKTINSIGAVGSASCAAIATFDTSTLDDVFNNAEFEKFVNENTSLDSSGNRTIKPGSDLATYIQYNDERMMPVGVMDGGILQSLNGGSSFIPFMSDILAMIKTFLGSSTKDQAIASGAAFVNSTNNANWKTYKFAQRFVALDRARSILRQYDGDATAYSNLKFFEGNESSVLAFINQQKNVANK